MQAFQKGRVMIMNWKCNSESIRINQLFSVQNKVVLITGAGGLGEMYAHAFAGNGAIVLLASRTLKKAQHISEEIQQKGYSCYPYLLDVSKKTNCNAIVNSIVQEFGHIDVLIHTAASCLLHDPLEDADDKIRTNMETNLMGSIYINRAVGSQMKKQKSGSIININTMSAFSVNSPDGTSYSISKSAVMQMTKWFAVALAPYHVTVNGIAPIWIDTPMMSGRSNSYMEHCREQVPMNRIANKEDYLGLALYMASNAGQFMTGQTILVDGGWSVSRVFSFDPDN